SPQPSVSGTPAASTPRRQARTARRSLAAMSSRGAAAPMLEMPPQEQHMAPLTAVPYHSQQVDPVASMGSAPSLSQALCCLCCWNPLTCAGGCVKVDQNESKAVMYWGRYSGTLSEPGMHFLNPWGIQLRSVSTKCNTMELKDIKVVDQRGNPVIISGVITYRNTSAFKACVEVENPFQFIMQQGTTVLKQVASRYPYGANPGQPSLQSECAGISSELVRALQEKTAVAGTQVLSFELVDLAYAPEIAQAMLVKQQAEALVDARRLIVGAAVDMAQTAVANLESGGASLSTEAKERITTTLLAVICSHSPATPTVPLSG
ncbi:unnamed protein product, partial [Prorocentrum cordatum]